MTWMGEGVLAEVVSIGEGVADGGGVDEGAVDVAGALLVRGLPVLKT